MRGPHGDDPIGVAGIGNAEGGITLISSCQFG
jgi:hypothetical protein